MDNFRDIALPKNSDEDTRMACEPFIVKAGLPKMPEMPELTAAAVYQNSTVVKLSGRLSVSDTVARCRRTQ